MQSANIYYPFVSVDIEVVGEASTKHSGFFSEFGHFTPPLKFLTIKVSVTNLNDIAQDITVASNLKRTSTTVNNMPRRRYDGPTEQDVAIFKRTVLSYLHSKGIEGGCVEVKPRQPEEHPCATAIYYTYPSNWTSNIIKDTENNIDKRLRKAFS